MGNLTDGPDPSIGSSAPFPSDQRAALAGVCDALGDLNSGVAEEFLRVAKSLQAISRRARDVTIHSKQAAVLAGGEDLPRALEMLHQMVQDMERVQQVVDGSRDRMETILAELQEARSPLLRLPQHPRLLATIAVLSRIEAYRIGSGAVDATLLTAEIGSLAAQIGDYVRTLGESAGSVTRLVREALGQTHRVEAQRRTEQGRLVQHTKAVLDPLSARAELSGSTAQHIDDQYAGIQAAVDSLVTSLQVQDIARQRIEHIASALSSPRQSSAHAQSDVDLALLGLQRSQLQDTRDLVETTVRSMVDSLGALQSRVGELSTDTSKLVTQVSGDGGSFVAAIEECLRAVCPLYEHYAKASKSVIGTFDLAMSSVQEMTRGVKDLQSIQVRMHRTALNAIVETSCLGAEGAALRALAVEVESVGARTKEDTGAVMRHLLAIEQVVNQTSTQEDTQDHSRLLSRDTESVRAELAGLAESVERANREVSRSLESALQVADVLTEDLRHAGELAERATEVTPLFDHALSLLDTLLGDWQPQLVTSGTPHSGGHAALQASYSMASERDIHNRFLQGPSDDASPTPPTPSDDAAGGYTSTDLGDGVELF